ncbi:Dolichyl-phosphate-mannose-protein mannosyltransferase-domain-containing protein [Fimicolochytrium jonesii]|uniref:Dolichyl-phosphate-mannose-protein mannosyltransferase-domain-containing protein n=1 Tax=Fimicolochytrium jonesii TaxID=1396493 RepID=UPI0022FE5AFB|nr:Dolichyl-phosphate-mannose-protein mannosyltransferase-domain-containing protein [Fimicolochytrium jonesii]KAI8824002.1 Dolichyl-phosphate-mannose-protein mannosyltransferase-domain-containing protein [Fimicolochytrium jonesii]
MDYLSQPDAGLRKRPNLKDGVLPSAGSDPNLLDVDFKGAGGKHHLAHHQQQHGVRRSAPVTSVSVIPTDQTQLIILGVLTLAAFITRLYKIGWANYVVWDEAHFGKFAGHYLKRTFYFDVHPPLGKMINGFAGLLAGFDGGFEFESGATYPPEVHYSIMRVSNALFGIGMVPLSYLTAIQLHLSPLACALVGTMVVFDVALACISRFILLDSMLLFFTVLSVFCLTVFRNHQRTKPFTPEWYFWLFATGVSLGTVLSVKWVGLFAIALVGLHTVDELWEMLGDLKMSPATYANHWIARIAGLIIAPMAVYTFSFVLHFAVLNHSGPGDAQMSSLFQAGLRGNNFHENPLELAYGSKISLKNNGHGGGLLHSHVQRYPTGSEQQQVTCYHHKDSNNEWIVTKPWGEEGDPEVVEFVKDGDVLRLVHEPTGRNLHSHNVKAPVTTSQNEVSCYGNATVGDSNDLWKVERVDDLVDKKSTRIRSLTTRFRLRHSNSGCLLRSHAVSLPQWGFKQAEVVCQKEADNDSRNHWWNIEEHSHEKLQPGGKNAYRSKFTKDFLDLNVAMWTSNNALTPDPDKEPDALTSQPYQWPFLLVGLRMCGWGDASIKYWLIGNPVVWWGSTASLAVFLGTCLVYAVRAKRHYRDFSPQSWDDFWFTAKVGFGGWALHYLPFFLMGRVTYLHHYFPALYFAILTFAFIVDHIGKRVLPPVVHQAVLGGVLAMVVVNFVYFQDFVYGFDTPAMGYKGRWWLKSWNLID